MIKQIRANYSFGTDVTFKIFQKRSKYSSRLLYHGCSNNVSDTGCCSFFWYENIIKITEGLTDFQTTPCRITSDPVLLQGTANVPLNLTCHSIFWK